MPSASPDRVTEWFVPLVPVASDVSASADVPNCTTLVDASGLFLYLSIAKLMIAKLHGG